MLRIDHGVLKLCSEKSFEIIRNEASMSGPLRLDFSEKANLHPSKDLPLKK
jgi:hypothetical protein